MSGSDNRSQPRANVFLAAALRAGDRQFPVRIRNLSPKGALVDGQSLPSAGSTIRLQRGHLTAEGELTWQEGQRGGLLFARAIDVQAWVKGVGHTGQRRVDEAIDALRHSGPVTDHEGTRPPESLEALSAALDRICERLSNSPSVSVEMAEALVELDIVAQSLRRLSS